MGNTGKKINPVLKKVVDGGPFDGQPLDDNNILTSVSGLPQDTMPNPVESNDYKVDDPEMCPPTVVDPPELVTYTPKYVINPNNYYCEQAFEQFYYSNTLGTDPFATVGIKLDRFDGTNFTELTRVENTSNGDFDGLIYNTYGTRVSQISDMSIPWSAGVNATFIVKVNGVEIYNQSTTIQAAILHEVNLAMYDAKVVEVISFINQGL